MNPASVLMFYHSRPTMKVFLWHICGVFPLIWSMPLPLSVLVVCGTAHVGKIRPNKGEVWPNRAIKVSAKNEGDKAGYRKAYDICSLQSENRMLC